MQTPDPSHLRPGRARRARLARLLVLIAALVVWLGCAPRSHGEEDGPPPGDPGEATEAEAAGSVAAQASAPPTLPPPLVLFHEGPLSEARARFDAGAWGEAADAFAQTLADDAVALDDEARARGLFLQGLSEQRAGRHADAERTLTAAAEADDLLADYARAQAAEAALEAGHLDAAAALAAAVRPEAALRGQALLTRARALLAATRRDEALAVLELARPHASAATRRAIVLTIAQAREAKGEHLEAAEGYWSLVKDHARTAEGRAARAALDALRPKLTREAQARFEHTPAPEDPLTRARDMYRRHRSEEVIPVLERVRREHPRGAAKALWCEATYLLAKSHSKLRHHGAAAPVYDEVIEGCEGVGDHHLNALYNVGKAYWNAGQEATAIARYATLVEVYPEHSFADDALLLKARIQFDTGEREAALATLADQVARYPKGDMVKDAHWLLFSERYRAGAFAEALAYADAHAADAGEDDLYTRGRLAYFRARSLEQLGRRAEALDAFEALVEGVPMSYYALLALGRLDALDAARATRLVARLRAAPLDLATERVATAPAALAASDHFRRGLALVELGLLDWAGDEFDRVGGDSAVQELLTWTRVALLDAAGEHPLSHSRAADLLGDPEGYPQGEARARWALSYPRPYHAQVWAQAGEQALRPHLVYAIMREESAFNPRIESWANARGLMQLMLPTARSTASALGDREPDAADLFRPEVGVRLGVAFLAKLARLFNHHPILVIAGYNAGQGNVGRWLDERGEQAIDLWVEDIPYGQTQGYTKRVLTTFWRYLWLYTPEGRLRFDPSVTAARAAGRVEAP